MLCIAIVVRIIITMDGVSKTKASDILADIPTRLDKIFKITNDELRERLLRELDEEDSLIYYELT